MKMGELDLNKIGLSRLFAAVALDITPGECLKINKRRISLFGRLYKIFKGKKLFYLMLERKREKINPDLICMFK